MTVNGETVDTQYITQNQDGTLTVNYPFPKTGLEIGTCGTNVKYTIDGDTIRYSTYDSRYETHWNSYSCRVPLLTGNIKKVYIDDKMLVDTNLQEAFSGNTYLEELHLNNFVMNLPDLNSAFSGCSSLKVVEISDLGNTSGLRSLYHTFAGCTSLEELDLSGWDTSNVEDMAYMFSGCSNLKNLKLHDKWVTSGLNNRLSSMFSGCTSLITISWSQALKRIGNYAFFGCNKLKLVDIDKCAELGIGDSAFEGCSELTTVKLAEGVYGVGSRCFAECKKLDTIVLPKSIRQIGESFLSNTEKLRVLGYRGSSSDWYRIKDVSVVKEGEDGRSTKWYYSAGTTSLTYDMK